MEYSKVKCYCGDSVRLRNPYSIEPKKYQQAFWALLLGKQLAKDIVELSDKIYWLITANFSGITIALGIFVISTEQCKTEFDLPYYFNSDPVRIGWFFFLPEEIFLGSRFDNTSFNTHGSENTLSILSPIQ